MQREITETVMYAAPTDDVEDAHGNATTTWAAPVPVGIYAFDPGSSSEPREGQSRVIVEPTIYFPAGVSLDPHGRVTARDKTYEIEGETREWGEAGSVATLRRVDG